MKTAESILKCVKPSLLNQEVKQTRLMKKKKESTFTQGTQQIKHKIKIELTADALTLASRNNKAATPNSICDFSEYDFYLNF